MTTQDNSKRLTIGIFAPSSSITSSLFEEGCEFLRDRGHRLVIHPQTLLGADSGKQPAGRTEEKIAAYRDLADMPEIDLIIAATGGNRSCFMLPELADLSAHKPLMGYSDTTALLAKHYKNGRTCYFGPTIQTLARMDERYLELTFDMIEDRKIKSVPMDGAKTLNSHSATAPLFAATLSNLVMLCGTDYMPDLNGHVLILEDIGDETNRFDRMLWQLFSQIKPAAVIFGQFLDTTDTGRPYGETMDQIIEKHAATLDCPVMMNAPIGHNGNILPLPIGEIVTCDATNRTLIF